MNHYDPEHAPNPEQWLALDEQVRIDLAEEHHRVARIKLPNLTIMKSLSSPRKMKDTVREAVERGRSNF